MLRNKPEDRSPDHLLGCVAEKPGGRIVPAGDDSIEILADDYVLRGGNDCRQFTQALGAVAERFFRLSKLGHIPDGAEDFSFRTSGFRLKVSSQFDPAERPVGAVHEPFKTEWRTVLGRT